MEVSDITMPKKTSWNSNSHWLHPSMQRASSTESFGHRVWKSICKSTRSCSICFTRYLRRHNSCGKTGCFITIYPFICLEHLAVPGWEEYHHTRTTDFAQCDIFSPQAQEDHQGELFWSQGGHQKGCNDRAEGYPKRILPAVHRSIAEKVH